MCAFWILGLQVIQCAMPEKKSLMFLTDTLQQIKITQKTDAKLADSLFVEIISFFLNLIRLKS